MCNYDSKKDIGDETSLVNSGCPYSGFHSGHPYSGLPYPGFNSCRPDSGFHSQRPNTQDYEHGSRRPMLQDYEHDVLCYGTMVMAHNVQCS